MDRWVGEATIVQNLKKKTKNSSLANINVGGEGLLVLKILFFSTNEISSSLAKKWIGGL